MAATAGPVHAVLHPAADVLGRPPRRGFGPSLGRTCDSRDVVAARN